MIVSEKWHQNLYDYIQFLFKKRFKVDKNRLFLVKKWDIQIIIFVIMLTRFSERIFIPMRYTGNKYTIEICLVCTWNIYSNLCININFIYIYIFSQFDGNMLPLSLTWHDFILESWFEELGTGAILWSEKDNVECSFFLYFFL